MSESHRTSRTAFSRRALLVIFWVAAIVSTACAWGGVSLLDLLGVLSR